MGYLSEQIDNEYEEIKESQQKANSFRITEEEEVLQLCEEMDLDTADLMNSTIASSSSVSINRSGLIRIEEEEPAKVMERPP